MSGMFWKFDLGKEIKMSKDSFLLSKSNQSTAGISLGNKRSMFSVVIEGGVAWWRLKLQGVNFAFCFSACDLFLYLFILFACTRSQVQHAGSFVACGISSCRHVGSNFLTMDQTCIPCIARQILHHCTTTEVPLGALLNFELNSILSYIHQILRMSLSLTPWDIKFDLIADQLLGPFIQIHVAWRSNLSSRKRSWRFTVECCSPSKIQVFEKPRCLAKLLANKECVTSWAFARSFCYMTSQLLINLLKTETCGATLLPASEGLHKERQRFSQGTGLCWSIFFSSSLDFRFSPHKRQV